MVMRKSYKTHSDPVYYIITMDQNGGKLSGYVTVHHWTTIVTQVALSTQKSHLLNFLTCI